LRNERKISRRDVLKAAGITVLPVPFQQDSGQERSTAAGGLQDPRMAGRPRERITDYENDPFIIEIESRLSCPCPCTLDVYTCRTTKFDCGTWPVMHRAVIELVKQDKTAEEIIEAFVAQYGETILMAPPKGGFNLVGYVLPGLGIFAVGTAMLWMLVGRSRSGREAVPLGAESTGTGSPISDEDAALLEKELEDLEL
jgi:cytochrome c-type biogenesis protein CcmH